MALRRLLAERLLDLRELDVEGFAVWLDRHRVNWAEDPVFLQRSRIRDLRRAHPELKALEEARRLARIEYERSPRFHDLEDRARELAAAENAVAGLTHAHRAAVESEERERLRLKL